MSKEGWNLRNRISTVALIFSIISVLFTGLTYLSNEAGKRGDLSFFVEGSKFAIDPYNISNPHNYALGFRINGIIINQGVRSLQIDSCQLTITIPISPSLKEYYNNTSAEFIKFNIDVISREGNSLDWTNRVIEADQQRNFNYTYWGMYDSFYSTLKAKDISGSLEIRFNDGIGVQFKEIEVIEWLQVGAGSLRI